MESVVGTVLLAYLAIGEMLMFFGGKNQVLDTLTGFANGRSTSFISSGEEWQRTAWTDVRDACKHEGEVPQTTLQVGLART